jgi:hypothetical protein
VVKGRTFKKRRERKMGVWRREKGSTILLTILVLAVGSALVISLAQTKQNSISSAIAQDSSTRALDLAESGLETVSQQARAHVMEGKELKNFAVSNYTEEFGGGQFRVKARWDAANNCLEITSMGRFGGVTRVIRKEVVPIAPPNTIQPGIAAKGSVQLNWANPGSYYGKNIILNGSASQLGGETVILSVPQGGSVINNVHGPLVEVNYNVPPPPEINVDFTELENYAKTTSSGVVVNSNLTWNNGIPNDYKNKSIIFVKGTVTINSSINLESNLTIVATGDIIVNGHPSFDLKKNGIELNLLSGRNLTVNGQVKTSADGCKSFFYSERNMVFNGHPSVYNHCQLRAKGDMTINGEARFAKEPMTINIPGVTVEGDGSGGGNNSVLAVVSWREIDPRLFD